jgi:malate/lactate dehydrogenase
MQGETYKYDYSNDQMTTNERIEYFQSRETHTILNNLSHLKPPYHLNILGLGDVGGTLITALRTLGSHAIASIGIYDLDEKRIERYVLELNQIFCDEIDPIPIRGINKSELPNCDMFVFTASRYIPPIGSAVVDVRMAQLQANALMIEDIVDLLWGNNFKGMLLIVSDPVDLLCQVAKDRLKALGFSKSYGTRIKGFGLGVMYARARYYAIENHFSEFHESGLVMGPHGKDLVVLNGLGSHYSKEKTELLRRHTIEANLSVRSLGYKPYIAPAVSSGAYAIKAMLEQKWHYSTVPFGNQFLGIKNSWNPHETVIESLPDFEPFTDQLGVTLKTMERDYENFYTTRSIRSE